MTCVYWILCCLMWCPQLDLARSNESSQHTLNVQDSQIVELHNLYDVMILIHYIWNDGLHIACVHVRYVTFKTKLDFKVERSVPIKYFLIFISLSWCQVWNLDWSIGIQMMTWQILASHGASVLSIWPLTLESAVAMETSATQRLMHPGKYTLLYIWKGCHPSLMQIGFILP